jgi:hypothetical protein
MGNSVLLLLYLGDGKRQTSAVWAKKAGIGALKAQYAQKNSRTGVLK